MPRFRSVVLGAWPDSPPRPVIQGRAKCISSDGDRGGAPRSTSNRRRTRERQRPDRLEHPLQYASRMKRMKRALRVILGISLFGAVFSGALTYAELFGQVAASCPAPGPAGTVLGYPACVYGFFMYLAIAATATVGLIAGRKRPERHAAREERSAWAAIEHVICCYRRAC